MALQHKPAEYISLAWDTLEYDQVEIVIQPWQFSFS